jgi:hypothetical protein
MAGSRSWIYIDDPKSIFEIGGVRYRAEFANRLADKLGHSLDVNQNVYTQSAAESRQVIVRAYSHRRMSLNGGEAGG